MVSDPGHGQLRDTTHELLLFFFYPISPTFSNIDMKINEKWGQMFSPGHAKNHLKTRYGFIRKSSIGVFLQLFVVGRVRVEKATFRKE